MIVFIDFFFYLGRNPKLQGRVFVADLTIGRLLQHTKDRFYVGKAGDVQTTVTISTTFFRGNGSAWKSRLEFSTPAFNVEK